MPTFRCNFDVTGDLVLPDDVNDLQLSNPDGALTTFHNASVDSEGHATGMIITVIGSAESIDTAKDELFDVLAKQLDLLSFATHSRFKIVAPKMLIEWEAGQKNRNFKAFNVVDYRYPPDPELDAKYIETVDKLEHARPPVFLQTALKYFRYGLLDTSPEDQFMRLWLSLEIIAENVKGTEPIPILCPQCSTAIKCGVCDAEPTRVPMAKQAIEELIGKVAGELAHVTSKRQFIARNGLMHGRSTKSIEDECKVSIGDIVDELATITWHAIMSCFPFDKVPALNFGHRQGEFVNKSLVMSVLGSFDHSGDGPHPTDDKIPNIEMTMETSFRKPGAEE